MKSGAVGSQLANLSILIVEDEIFVAKTLEKVFRDHNAGRIDVAMLLSRAQDLIAANDYDAVILDLRLPDGEAYSLADQLLADQVPVIIHSGHAGSDYEERFPKASYCPKPSTPERLIASVIKGRATFES